MLFSLNVSRRLSKHVDDKDSKRITLFTPKYPNLPGSFVWPCLRVFYLYVDDVINGECFQCFSTPLLLSMAIEQ